MTLDHSPVQPSPSTTVLVVDDEPALCNSVRMILELEGYHVRTATSGPQALAEARREPPAVVLLDLHMPGMDGWQTYAVLHEQIPELPVVFMTGKSRVWQEADAHHATGALPKPFDVDLVLDTIGRFIPASAP
jgi:CheY-like chemotaxis protein